MKLYFYTIFYFLLTSLAFSQDTTWRCTYGGNGYDEGRAVIQTFDGSFLVAGATSSFGYGASDVYVIKVDSNGNKIWSNVYGGANTDYTNSLGFAEIENIFLTLYI